jgi:hypothetical protein
VLHSLPLECNSKLTLAVQMERRIRQHNDCEYRPVPLVEGVAARQNVIIRKAHAQTKKNFNRIWQSSMLGIPIKRNKYYKKGGINFRKQESDKLNTQGKNHEFQIMRTTPTKRHR